MTSDVKIDLWDVKANDWMETVYTLPDSLNQVAEALFESKRIVVRVTMNGKVRYISTDQPARPQLTRREA